MKEYLIETNRHMGGIQKVYKFPNGYGASVIQHKGSYGYQKGLWEVAVLFHGELCYYQKGLWEVAVLFHGELCYDTEITEDVIGHLNDPQVDNVLGKIFRL